MTQTKISKITAEDVVLPQFLPHVLLQIFDEETYSTWGSPFCSAQELEGLESGMNLA